MKPTERDIDILARTVYGEARGESDLGKLAVAHVVMNRVKADVHGDGRPDWWGEGIAAVCLKPRQFTCWDDANRLALMQADLSDPAFARCLVAAIEAAHGLKPDPTGGATHYLGPGAARDWARDKAYVTLGRHRFFTDVE